MSYPRALSIANTRRTDQFKQEVGECDGMLVITKIKHMDSWFSFHATDIFPIAYKDMLD